MGRNRRLRNNSLKGTTLFRERLKLHDTTHSTEYWTTDVVLHDGAPIHYTAPVITSVNKGYPRPKIRSWGLVTTYILQFFKN